MANYLYNGVELPELPEDAKEEYPYAVIAYGNLEGLVLFLSKTPIQYMTTDGNVWGGLADKLVIDGEYKKYDRLIHDGEGLVELDYWKPSDIPDSLFIMESSYTDNGYVPAFKWANHDVLEGDIIRIAASEPVPVPVYDHTAMVQGWIVGKRLAAMRGKKEPVAYLYNGVRLPKLPEWDKEKYPYAYVSDWVGIYVVWTSSTPLVVHKTIDGVCLHSNGVKVEHLAWLLYSNCWNKDNVSSGYGEINSPCVPIWANYDVYYYGDIQTADGTLFLAASDPVPVYD